MKENRRLLWINIVTIAIYIASNAIWMRHYEDSYGTWVEIVGLIVIINSLVMPTMGIVTQRLYVANTKGDKALKWVILVVTMASFVFVNINYI